MHRNLHNQARFIKLAVGREKPLPYWSTKNEVVLHKKTLNLRHFPHRKIKQKIPVLILPPQAGNASAPMTCIMPLRRIRADGQTPLQTD